MPALQRGRHLVPENRDDRFGAGAITGPEAGSDPRRLATIVLVVVQPDGASTMFRVGEDVPGVRLGERVLSAARAVGTAVGKNPISFVEP